MLAGLGSGNDQPTPDADSRQRLRRQALEALKTQLAESRRLLHSPSPETSSNVFRVLHRWWNDPDLAGVRATASLAKLPDSERQAWLEVWADVDRLVESTKPAP